MNPTNLSIAILAAGKGTRMHSNIPKVLHRIAGKPMVLHVIETVKQLNPQNIYLIYGHGGEQLQHTLNDTSLNWVLQTEQLGTGHAMQQVAPCLKDDESVLIVYGDCPLISLETLEHLIRSQPTQPNGISLLTVELDDPTGYGRILRQNGKVVEIVEQKDATPEQQAITEVNTGVMVAHGASLKKWLACLDNHNAQQEFYLTDIIKLSNQEKGEVRAVKTQNAMEVEGVNDRQQLARLERYYQQNQAENLLLAGVSLSDPSRFDLRGKLTHGKDVHIDINVIIEGKVILGNNVKIGAGCLLKDCTIADNTILQPYCVIENAHIGTQAKVGPFSRLRPGTELAAHTHIGNFVEIKKSIIGQGSKINHLSYVGDSTVGGNCNIGAGVITCNYDGANKFKTEIGHNVFVGSDVQLVAPVKVADNATIGAGTTVTRDINEGELVISRIPQKHIVGWQRPQKKK